MSAALGGLLTAGYGRQAGAGDCVDNGGFNFTCSGAADLTTDNQQNLGDGSSPVVVTTGPDFGINVTAVGADAFNITSDGGLKFTQEGSDPITGASSGIVAKNDGSGELSITALTVTGTNDKGIYAFNAGTDLTISAADVGGGTYGIFANNFAVGALSITATGPVTGASGSGILAFNAGTDLTISASAVEGGGDGITADNSYGKGALSITAYGAVTGATGNGITAINGGAGGLTISGLTVAGGTDGVNANNTGGGASSITVTGVTGTSGNGVYALNAGTDLTISTKNVGGGTHGIFANNTGSGALWITAAGAVTGTSGNGVYALNAGTDLTISTKNVSGGLQGIYANNTGSGATSITATGPVYGLSGGSGIFAKHAGSGNLTISSFAVFGDTNGIDAHNSGAGALSITADGPVTGTNGNGISADNAKTGTDLTISATAVSGGQSGIIAKNSGAGPVTITATGPVAGGSGDGIYALNYSGDLTISAADVSGGDYGVSTRNLKGSLSLTASGTVTGAGGSGIASFNYFGDYVTITAATVVGNDYGIFVYSVASGELSITATDTVTGTGKYGISATNIAGKNTTIALPLGAAVKGGTGGVYVSNQYGALSITGAGVITGNNGNGINAVNTGTDLTIDASTVSGSQNGINAKNSGTGSLSITVTDAVTGTGNYGIRAENNGGKDLSITLSEGATAEGASGGVFANHLGASGGFIATNNGIIRSLSQSPGDLAFKAVSDLVGVEIVNASSGALLGRIEATAMGDNFENTGLWTNTGTSDFGDGTDTLNNLAGGTIQVADDSTVNETATWASLETFNHIEGTLTFADGNAGDQLTTSGDFNGGGTIAVDVNFVAETADMFNIGGSVAGSPTGVTVDAVGGVVQTPGDPGIAVITVDGNTTDGDFFVSQQLGIYSYNLSLEDTDGVSTWYVQPEQAPGPFGGVNIVDPAFVFLSVQPAALNLGRDLIGTLWERVGLREDDRAVNGVSDGSDRDAFGTWFRISGSWIDGDGAIETSSGAPDASYDTDQWLVQGGAEGRLYQGTDGQLIGGVFAHWATSDTNADALDGSDAGTVDMDAYGGGASLTWYGANGLYADALAQATAYQVDMSAVEEGALGSPDGWGFGTSLEVGYSAEIAPGVSLVPQAQLVYQSVSFDDFTDQLGNAIVWDTSESLEGRLGLAIETGDRGASGTGLVAYADANLIHDFFDTEGVSISGDDIEFDRSPTSIEVGGGINLVAIEEAVGITLYVDGDYRFPIDGDGVSVIQATAGVRVNW